MEEHSELNQQLLREKGELEATIAQLTSENSQLAQQYD